ncbi:MAG: phosphatidylglycerophosphatase A [Proteobacteria bacterium]|nr:phosphatidylglycerophosphatase A [Pseudomonadota bacterium]
MSETELSTKVWQNPTYFLAFGFGSGLMPIAPGTWGTIAAIPLYLLISSCPLVCYLFLTFIVFLIGVKLSDDVSKELGFHDFSGIVIDEIAGFLLTMTAAPVNALWIVIGFLLFRLFDIWKPQPIRMIDKKVKGGLGIMLDDILAAVPAWIILQLLILGFGK